MSEPNWELLGGGGTLGGPVDYVGDWAAASTYTPGQVVRYAGVDYLAVNPSTGQVPPTANPNPQAVVCLYDSILAAVAANFDIQAIPQNYAALRILAQCRGDTAAQQTNLLVRVNGDSGSNYSYQYDGGSGSTVSAAEVASATQGYNGQQTGATADAGATGLSDIVIPNYASALFHKYGLFNGHVTFQAAAPGRRNDRGSWNWRSTAPINRLTFFPNAGNWAAGSRLTIYGLLSVGQSPPVTTLAPGGIGTTLPASPANGEVYTLVDSLTAPTYSWTFRYVAGISDANKWVYVGGAPISSEVETSESRNSITYGDTATVHSLTLPRAGVYEFEYGFRGEVDTGENNSQYMSPKYSASEAVDADAAIVLNIPEAVAAAHFFMVSRRKRLTVTTPGQVVTMRYRQSTAHTTSPVDRRWVKVTPVRVA